jgi:hypothetical protein
MNKTELKKTVTKIKKFLKQKDYAAIDTGIELAADKPSKGPTSTSIPIRRTG